MLGNDIQVDFDISDEVSKKEYIKYLELLSREYKNIQAASTEIINLQAISSLPKGTEHFMSDLHGEYQAFEHILNNASGDIRGKINALFGDTLDKKDRAALATLIYYPKEKLEEQRELLDEDNTDWYKITLNRLISLCHLVSSKYTRSKVRKALPNDFSYIIEELLNNDCSDPNKIKYYKNIIDTIIDIDRADAFILALCTTIKKLVVDHLHIVGDVFDRGPRPDIIMDALVNHHSLDIQWGNHDVLWMGAAAGSFACIASVLNNSITYNNLDVIEIGYGISLRPLATFANEIYKDSDVSLYKPKIIEGQKNFDPEDINLCARMRKAILMIAFKLEGQIIKRNPDFKMDDRLLLNRIDFDMNTININGKNYKLKECDFKTIDKDDPYNLTKEEYQLMKRLRSSFINSEKLQRHIKFLYTHGSVYNCYNGNLLFHGCVPFNDDGTLMEFTIKGNTLTGKDFMDYSDSIARQGYYAKPKSKEKIFGEDFLWFLWCGKNSPLFGRNKIATFERLFIEDKDTWVESKNAYYKHYLREETCIDILNMFGLHEDHSHIINGHVPVETKKGENPIKANGKLIVIDGGFCKAYQNATGIAGYTLIYSSYGMRLCSHEPFDGQANAIKNNTDILSDSVVFEHATKRIQVSETDIGKRIKLKIIDLRNLLKAYVSGVFNEHI